MTITRTERLRTCSSCGGATIAKGVTDVVERSQTTVVLTNVPAHVCERCGDTFIDDETRGQMQAILDQAERTGKPITRQRFAAR